MASKDSAFGIPEVRRGLVAGGGGLLRLPQRIPSAIAMELALTGENLSAERAHALGMVNVLAEPGTALDAAIALAEKIAANGPLAVAATKQIIVESRGWSPDDVFRRAEQAADAGVLVQRRQGRRDRVRREAAGAVDRYLRSGGAFLDPGKPTTLSAQVPRPSRSSTNVPKNSASIAPGNPARSRTAADVNFTCFPH